MKRDLCYRHHALEFDKLPSASHWLAADWRTVEPCEMCAALYAEALAELAMIVEGWDAIESNKIRQLSDWELERREFARAVLAGAWGKGG